MVIHNKYFLYERAVQSPESHLDLFKSVFQEIRGCEPRSLREDFCGTFKFSTEWVKHHPKNTAICVDLDLEPLNYGKQHHWAKLSSSQKKRLQPTQGDVLKYKSTQTDLIIACNFSFFIFKERDVLLSYFKNSLKSLNQNGMIILESAGGPGMITKSKEQKTIYLEDQSKYIYVWDQKSFNPITCEANYSIHFKHSNGKVLKDAFTYDWRLWSIPETRDLLKQAGFKQTYVYWETEHRGTGTGEFVRTDSGDNAFAWIAYIAATK